MTPKDADGMANSVDSDQTAHRKGTIVSCGFSSFKQAWAAMWFPLVPHMSHVMRKFVTN